MPNQFIYILILTLMKQVWKIGNTVPDVLGGPRHVVVVGEVIF